MLVNLLPYWIIQPWVDAAFKKRGIDPQEFWRNSGLPAFRFPDPNGQRQANGAPPAAPTPLEGTPEHPGSCRHRGHAVLLHAARGRIADVGRPAAVLAPGRRTVRRQPVRRQLRGPGTRRRRSAPEPGRGRYPLPASRAPRSPASSRPSSPAFRRRRSRLVRQEPARFRPPRVSRRIRTSRPDPFRATAPRRCRLRWSDRPRHPDQVPTRAPPVRLRYPATRHSSRPAHRDRGTRCRPSSTFATFGCQR